MSGITKIRPNHCYCLTLGKTSVVQLSTNNTNNNNTNTQLRAYCVATAVRGRHVHLGNSNFAQFIKLNTS